MSYKKHQQCKSGNFRGTFIFALDLATAKIKTREYILYMSSSMERKSKIANKKTSEFALNWLTTKMYTCENYHFYSTIKWKCLCYINFHAFRTKSIWCENNKTQMYTIHVCFYGTTV